MNNTPINIKSLHINAAKALGEKNYDKGKILLEKILLVQSSNALNTLRESVYRSTM